MTIAFSDIVKLIEVSIWPAIVLAVFLLLRKQLPHIIEELGRRVKKISVGNYFQMELSIMSEAAINWTIPYTDADIRQPAPVGEFTSGASTLMEQIKSSDPADYAVIDLGDRWLTSRLFIFAIILDRMRKLKYFVFLETRGGVRRKFLGVATPNAVRWKLAQRYSKYEQEFAKAYAELDKNIQIQTETGALEPPQAASLVTNFLSNVQDTVVKTPLEEKEGWIYISEKQFYEYGEWLDGDKLKNLLGNSLDQSHVIEKPHITREDIVKSILVKKGKFIAKVDNNMVFRDLVDREQLLNLIGMKLAAQQEP
jgi:hypothetical protein